MSQFAHLTCAQKPDDYLTASVMDDPEIPGDLHVYVSSGVAYCDVALSKGDAIELAWGILENLNVAQRPVQPVREGSLVRVNNGDPARVGTLGRVTMIRNTAGHISAYIRVMNGSGFWASGQHLDALSPSEFKVRANDEIKAILAEAEVPRTS